MWLELLYPTLDSKVLWKENVLLSIQHLQVQTEIKSKSFSNPLQKTDLLRERGVEDEGERRRWWFVSYQEVIAWEMKLLQEHTLTCSLYSERSKVSLKQNKRNPKSPSFSLKKDKQLCFFMFVAQWISLFVQFLSTKASLRCGVSSFALVCIYLPLSLAVTAMTGDCFLTVGFIGLDDYW